MILPMYKQTESQQAAIFSSRADTLEQMDSSTGPREVKQTSSEILFNKNLLLKLPISDINHLKSNESKHCGHKIKSPWTIRVGAESQRVSQNRIEVSERCFKSALWGRENESEKLFKFHGSQSSISSNMSDVYGAIRCLFSVRASWSTQSPPEDEALTKAERRKSRVSGWLNAYLAVLTDAIKHQQGLKRKSFIFPASISWCTRFVTGCRSLLLT
jgi:hypothetical protein